MFDLQLRKYICPKSRKINDILMGFRTFYDKLSKYKEIILNELINHPELLRKNVNDYKHRSI